MLARGSIDIRKHLFEQARTDAGRAIESDHNFIPAYELRAEAPIENLGVKVSAAKDRETVRKLRQRSEKLGLDSRLPLTRTCSNDLHRSDPT